MIETARLHLRRPVAGDAEAIFARYASDGRVTRYVGWPTHKTLEASRDFVAFSDGEWERWRAGPLLVEDRASGELLGSTGLAFDAPALASTGYVLAVDAWGRGYATEALAAMVEWAAQLGLRSLYALVHGENGGSIRVLGKGGFILQSTREMEFPNLMDGARAACLRYERMLTPR
jgi:[ribosomal protein S5]-alanine N-acetyltransferase